MKKIVPILLAVALALALCLVGFADAERYDDDPLEETAVPTSEAVLEEAEPGTGASLPRPQSMHRTCIRRNRRPDNTWHSGDRLHPSRG